MASPAQALAENGKVALTNARVFDGRQLVDDRTVVIEAGRIAADPRGARVIDCGGGVLLPGLIDAHVHLDGPGRLETLAGYGVTTALDMASLPEETAALRGRAGQTDIRSAGIPAIAPGSFHAHIPGVGQRGLIASPAEAERFVADRIAEGSDYIKIVVGSPLADHDQATIDALVTAAHEQGKIVVAHASSAGSVAKAQAAGADILTHAPLDQALAPAAAAEAAASGRVAVPTLTMMEGIVAASRGCSTTSKSRRSNTKRAGSPKNARRARVRKSRSGTATRRQGIQAGLQTDLQTVVGLSEARSPGHGPQIPRRGENHRGPPGSLRRSCRHAPHDAGGGHQGSALPRPRRLRLPRSQRQSDDPAPHPPEAEAN